MTLLGIKFDVISFYGVICYVERQWSGQAEEPFLWKI